MRHRLGIARALIPLSLGLALVGLPGLLEAQEIDQTYTEKILEYTTEPFFLTPYVDHLPASESVPTPLDVLGHIVGAPDILSYPEEVYGYMRAVAAASPRVEVFTIGRTEEGREMILVAVSDEETIANLDQYKDMNGRLGDPRVTDEAEAEALIGTAKPMYWATGAIHSPETGSPEMLMELVYRLAVDESPFIQTIRDSAIILVTPVVEVDGRAKVVDLHMAPRKDSNIVVPRRPLYWGKYVAHDNNRDAIGLSLNLSRNIVNTFLEFHPQILHDLHESASHLYTSTGRGPYNAWLDPIVINEWNNIAYQEVKEMTGLGVPGVYTHDFYDGWAPNYMFWIAQSHNAIGRFYETQGAGNASTRVLRNSVQRQWHRPNTPLKEVMWSIRNNVNLQQSAILIAMNYVATNKTEFLHNYYRKAQRSVAKATAEGPAAYVFAADDPRPALQARLLRLLQTRGIEVQRATDDFTVGEDEYAEGSYIVRMDQPYSRSADELLDRQYYNPNDPRPYDDVGWTLGPLFNVDVTRVEDAEILSASMEMVEAPVMARGGVDGDTRNAAAFVIDYTAQNSLASFRFAHPDLDIDAAESEFELDDHSFGAGSFILRIGSNSTGLADVLAQGGREYGFTAYGVSSVPEVSMHPVATPRVAVVHTWSNTQSEGWLRIGLDQHGIPFDYISVHDIRDIPNLEDRWDVLVFGPSSGDALSLLRGVTGDTAIAWQKTDITPNIGAQASTSDMRGGIELQGVINLANFVEAGGTFVTISNTSSLPIHFGMAQGIRVKDTPNLWARGGVYRVKLAKENSPLAYGYGEELGVYFNTAPVFARGSASRRRFGGFGGRQAANSGRSSPGSTTARRTGRGGRDEEDIVQGRPRDMGKAGVEAWEAEHDGEPETPSFSAAPPSNSEAIFRFASARDLLISGGINNAQELAGAPAMVDSKLGDGHIVMFSFNPFWRGETLGSYSLLFNALLHHGNLDTPEPEEPATTEDSSSQ